MEIIKILTKSKEEVIDITETINRKIKERKIGKGLCHLFLTHTTAVLTTADLDPGTDKDLLQALRAMIPKLKYRHPHNPEHVGDHILSSIIGTSLSLPIKDNELMLGAWQRIVLIEFSGPRNREIILSFVKN